MPDSNPPTPPAPGPQPGDDHTPKPRGYFNQAQLEDLELAEDVLGAAQSPGRPARLATRAITEAYVTGLGGFIGQARGKTSETGQANDATGAATLNAAGAERDLLIALHAIQSAAKQKKRMLDEEDAPAAKFSTDGYLIGARLNLNRATLLQSADTLIRKAGADALPGYDAAGIAAVEKALKDYRDATGGQHAADEELGTDRGQRDRLIKKINSRRMAIQHAADALWPFTTKANRPIRKAFHLPPARPLNG